MGYSMTSEKADKINALAAEARRCSMNNGRGGCATRATVMVVDQSFVYRLDEGAESVTEMPMCARHARQMPVGFEGVNFRVLDHRRF
jgi:hypothetical protein